MENSKPAFPEPEYLIRLSKMIMPFGKYKGRRLLEVPEHYLVWFSQKGFPSGELGEMLAVVYEIKLNGLMYLMKPFLKAP